MSVDDSLAIAASGRDFARLALLFREPQSIPQAAARAGCSVEQTRRFFNGSTLCGRTRAHAPAGQLVRRPLPLPDKLLWVGPPGAGKSQAIATISTIPPLRTELPERDGPLVFDYGQAEARGHALSLYGVPGTPQQARLWQQMLAGRLAAVLLLDHSRADPLGDLNAYAMALRPLLAMRRVVVGINRHGVGRGPTGSDYARCLQASGYDAPLLIIDPRRRADVELLVDALCLAFGHDPAPG